MKNNTALQLLIKTFEGLKDGSKSKTDIAYCQAVIDVIKSKLPIEQGQIETAHKDGIKSGFKSGRNSALGIFSKSIAEDYASDYFKNTYND